MFNHQRKWYEIHAVSERGAFYGLKTIYTGIMPEDEAEAVVKVFEKFRAKSITCLKNSIN